ncbi:DUF2167 domain-containing protein [Hydromonas duriensis]|nr:DUF2167 domain-containing protein [Hydromonas duriensis]
MKKVVWGMFWALVCLSKVTWAVNDAAIQEAWAAADKVAQKGPFIARVAGQAELNIPKNYFFVPQKEAQALMKSFGNGESPELYGIIVPADSNDNGIYTVKFVADGYVKDDEAKDLKADEILEQYKEGTEQGNKERVAQGFQAIEVSGWAQKPVYDAQLHRLTWAMVAHDKGATGTENDSVNYQTRLLGREGVLSVTLLAEPKYLTESKAKTDELTAGLHFVDGKRYEDFSASLGDKVAEYGLAALITGAVAKKLGLFALILAFLAKFAKLALVGVLGVFPFLKRFFKKKDADGATAQVPTTDVSASETEPKSSAPMEPVSIKQIPDELKDSTKM